MGEHALLSPSSAHRWMRCPGSVALCAGRPDVETEASAEGTFAHSIAGEALLQRVDADHFLGARSGCGRFEVDEEFAEAVQVYLDCVRGLELLHGDGETYIEQRVTATSETWGTADYMLVSCVGRRLDVADLKFGRGKFVDVDPNEQLLTYGLGAIKKLFDKFPKIETVGLHIVQPRHFGSAKKWRSIEVGRGRLLAFEVELVAAAAKTKRPDAPLVPGELQCSFCPGKSICPALREIAVTAAADVFAERVPAKPSEMPPAEIARLLPLVEQAEAWFKALRATAHDLARNGLLPGFKVVETEGRRTWRDEAEAREALEMAGIDPNGAPKVRSPAQAEQSLKAAGMKKKAAAALVAQFTHNPVTGSALVPVSDPRPATNRADVFAEGESE